MVKTGRVAVAGGSLGGLTAALLLRDAGFDVTVHERSTTELQQRGAGIGFLYDSARYLIERAGVALDDISISTEHIRYLGRDGAVTHDLYQPYRFSSWNTVYRSLLGQFGPERYRLGHEVVDAVDHGQQVELVFGDGTRDPVDLLVCADGVGSSFRARLVPGARRTYAGYVAWRGMVPEGDLDPNDAAALTDAITYHVYANSHILVYPIPGLDGSVEPGRRLVNFVWYRNYANGGDLADVLTDVNGERREISLPPGAARPEHVAEVRAAAAARLPRLLAEVVERTGQPFLQVVYDVEIDRMVVGRMCLVGDAAWVARPHAAAGTAKAAADGWALVDALTSCDSMDDALARFEREEMQLGRALVDRTRRIGAHSQFSGTWEPTDPELIFGLREPGR